MHFRFCLFLLLHVQLVTSAQEIQGSFSELKSEPVRLLGFDGIKSKTIDSTVTNEAGTFIIHYDKSYQGIGILQDRQGHSMIVILTGESIRLLGTSLNSKESIRILSGKDNQLFERYVIENTKREQALSAWQYLLRIYQQDSLFAQKKQSKQHIENEIASIKKEDSTFINSIPTSSYLRWYIENRKLISSVTIVAQHRVDEIPATIRQLQNINFLDRRWLTSGLLSEAIEATIWLIENSGLSTSEQYRELNAYSSLLVNQVKGSNHLLTELTNHLFDFLEKRSLFPAAEFLALRVLEETSCSVVGNLSDKLEQYRTMKPGKLAPVLTFSGIGRKDGQPINNVPKTLADISSRYKLVVFGASWCPHCPNDLLTIRNNYARWKQKGIEVIFISLDTNPTAFESFSSPFPFLSFCDYQTWESPMVKAWYVFATPTMYLVNETHQIELRPNSIEQLISYIDWKIQ